MKDDSEDSGTTRQRSIVGRVRWFAAELVIIIAGILIALAIDEWREEIENERRKQEYLGQLVADLLETEERVASSRARNEQVERAAAQMVAAFQEGGTNDLERLRDMLVKIVPYTVPSPVLGTVETLISTGDLRLIGDLNSRTAITKYLAYNRELQNMVADSGSYHTERVDQLRHLAMIHGIVPGEVDIPDSGILDASKDADLVAFFEDRPAYSYAQDIYREKRFMTILRREISSSAADLRNSLEPLIALD